MEPIPNPLRRFPVKRDSTLKSFNGTDSIKKHYRRTEGTKAWLNPLQLDPSFGIQGDDDAATLRRSYRRIQSSALFVSPKLEDASLGELVQSDPKGKKKLVLVEESRLAELSRYEVILRQEKKRLEDQCLLVSDPTLGIPLVSPPHLPIPATRLAIHSACDAEMKKYGQEIRDMNAQWAKFSALNHYNRSYLVSQTAQLQSLPIGMRLIKLNAMEQEAQEWLLRKAQDTMSYEDDIGHLYEKYEAAKFRKLDYDRYFILATRYGAWTADQFAGDPHPGKTYWHRVLRGAIKMQRVWVHYWTFTKVKRYNAAVKIQAQWRGYWKFKTMNPIIKLRMRVGRRAAYAFCWALWLDYNAMCRRIKSSLSYMMIPWHTRCFQAWAKYVEGIRKKKEASLRKFILRMRNLELAGLFLTWVGWLNKRKKTKRYLRRMFQLPQFDMWLEYVAICKHRKFLSLHATIIQKSIRGFVARRKYKYIRQCISKLYHFALIVLAKRRTKFLRREAFEIAFQIWKPAEEAKRLDRATENERRRLIKQQQVVQDREFKVIGELKKHLKTHNGYLQVTELAYDIKEGKYSSTEIPSGNLAPMDALRDVAAKELIKQCKHTERSLEKHEFNVKNPPFIRCADPKCSAVFTSAEQYHMHVRKSKIHHDRNLIPKTYDSEQGGADGGSRVSTAASIVSRAFHSESPYALFSNFHLLLRHKLGSGALLKYISRVYGSSDGKAPTIANCVEFWLAVQDWKRTSCHIENYYNSKAFAILDTFLLPTSPKCLPIIATPNIYSIESSEKGLVSAVKNIRVISSAMVYPESMDIKPQTKKSWWPFKSKAEDSVTNVALDFHAAEDKLVRESVGSLVDRLCIARDSDSKSQFETCEARLSLWRKMMRMPPERFEKWTDAHKVPASAFDALEWYCFRTLFSAITLDSAFVDSAEHAEYRDLLIADEDFRIHTLRHDLAQIQKSDLRRWTSQFRFLEMAISKKAEEILNKCLVTELPRQLGEYIDECLVEHVAELSYEEQVNYEANMMVVDEAITWVAMACAEDIYDFYVPALLKQMWGMQDMRRKLLIFAGIVEDTVPKKKLYVDMEVSKQRHKATYQEFIAVIPTEKAPSPTVSSRSYGSLAESPN